MEKTWVDCETGTLRLFLVSRSLSSMVRNAEIHPGYRTDHSLITLELSALNQDRGKGWYKFNVSLLRDPQYVEMINQTFNAVTDEYVVPLYEESFRYTPESVRDMKFKINDSLLWETVILRLRTETITYSIRKARQLKRREEDVWNEICRLENDSSRSQEQLTINSLRELKKEYEEMRKTKLEGAIIRSRVRWQEDGERPTAYFCKLERRNVTSKLIASLKIGNEIVTGQDEILDRFRIHFARLFKQDSEPSFEQSIAYLRETDLPKLTKTQLETLSSPPDLGEFSASLYKMEDNKTPGSDGLPAEFYKFFWKMLKYFFSRIFNESMETGLLRLTLREGLICLIHKKDKPKNEITGI